MNILLVYVYVNNSNSDFSIPSLKNKKLNGSCKDHIEYGVHEPPEEWKIRFYGEKFRSFRWNKELIKKDDEGSNFFRDISNKVPMYLFLKYGNNGSTNKVVDKFMYLNKVRNSDFLIHPDESTKRDPDLLKEDCIKAFNFLNFLILEKEISMK